MARKGGSRSRARKLLESSDEDDQGGESHESMAPPEDGEEGKDSSEKGGGEGKDDSGSETNQRKRLRTSESSGSDSSSSGSQGRDASSSDRSDDEEESDSDDDSDSDDSDDDDDSDEEDSEEGSDEDEDDEDEDDDAREEVRRKRSKYADDEAEGSEDDDDEEDYMEVDVDGGDAEEAEGGSDKGNKKKKKKKKKKPKHVPAIDNFATYRAVERMHEGESDEYAEEQGHEREGDRDNAKDDGGNDEHTYDDGGNDENAHDDGGNDENAHDDGGNEDNADDENAHGDGVDDENAHAYRGDDDGEDDDPEDEERARKQAMQDDPDCCNRMSKSLRVVDITDVQIDPKTDGAVFCFTCPAEGPTLPSKTMQQIQVLLHVINSFVPPRCIVETETLKPIFDQTVEGGGLERMEKIVRLTEEESRQYEEFRQGMSDLPISEIPFENVFYVGGEGPSSGLPSGPVDEGDGGGGDDAAATASLYSRHIQGSMQGGAWYRREIVPIADILVIPVCFTYTVRSQPGSGDARHASPGSGNKRRRKGDGEEDDPPSWGGLGAASYHAQGPGDGKESKHRKVFFCVVVVPRQSYDLVDHIHWLVNAVDKDDKSCLKRLVTKEHEEVMNMLREVILYQYEQSPNAVAYFRSQGPGCHMDPLQRITRRCTPDSLDHVCSIYEAFRAMQYQLLTEDPHREIINVSGFSDMLLMTSNMLERSLETQRDWHVRFQQHKSMQARKKAEYAKAHRMKNEEERQARLMQLELEFPEGEVALLPAPVLYPIPKSISYLARPRNTLLPRRFADDGASDSGRDRRMRDVLFDEYDVPSPRGEDDDDDQVQYTGLPDFPVIMRVDILGKCGKEKTALAFQANFGGLPAMALQKITEMLYNGDDGSGHGGDSSDDNDTPDGFVEMCVGPCTKERPMWFNRRPPSASSPPLSPCMSPSKHGAGPDASKKQQRSRAFLSNILLPDPVIMQAYTRVKHFSSNGVNTNGIKKAGSDLHLLTRIVDVVRATHDPVQKIRLMDDYLRRAIRQHVSSVLNYEIRSSNIVQSMQRIEKAKGTVCKDLKKLIAAVYPNLRSLMRRKDHEPSRGGGGGGGVHGAAAAPEYVRRRRKKRGRDGGGGDSDGDSPGTYVVRDELYDHAARNPGYWHLHFTSTFQYYSLMLDDLHREHNEQFVHLTAQNLEIANDVWTTMVQYRLGSHEEWVHMGMATAVVDAGGKLERRANFPGAGSAAYGGMPITTKRPGMGLDLTKIVVDTRTASCNAYDKGGSMNQGEEDDAQAMTQVRKMTAASFHTTFILVVNDKVVSVPTTELGANIVLSEGIPNIDAVMDAAFQMFPRDGSFVIEIWSTADPNRTNIRVKTVYKIVPGFPPFICLMGHNQPYESKIEARYRDLLIVCNVKFSSGMVDEEGLYRSRGMQAARRFGAREGHEGVSLISLMDCMENSMDAHSVRKGVVRSDMNPKFRNKGPSPTEQAQRLWAPLHYYVHAVAGNVLALMHKMGMYRLMVNYGVASVSRFLFDYVTSTLGDFMDTIDKQSAGRYFDVYLCRMVAETVMRTAFMAMAECDDLDSAVLYAMNSLMYNAMDLTLVPVLQERLVLRIVQYKPLLAIATIGIAMGIPVVSMKSILELLNGRQVTSQEDLEAMRAFLQNALDMNYAIQYLGMDAYGAGSGTRDEEGDDHAAAAAQAAAAASSVLPGYITCPALTIAYRSAQSLGLGISPANNSNNINGGGAGSAGGQRQQGNATASNTSMHGIPMDAVRQIINNMFKRNETVLKNCAFLQDSFGFEQCILSLMQRYDLRAFFGGMEAYHDQQRLADILGLKTKFSFPRDFVEGVDGRSDPVMLPARIPRYHRRDPAVSYTPSQIAEADVCLSMHWPTMLLIVAMIKRLRRDTGICYDFANTITENCMSLMPASIMPYDVVNMTRGDQVAQQATPVLMEMRYNADSYGGLMTRPDVIPRHVNPNVVDANFRLQCSGTVGTMVLEDEHYMGDILMRASYMGVPWTQFPLDQCPAVRVHWEYGVCYPMQRVFIPEACKRDMRADGDQGGGDAGGGDDDMDDERCFEAFLSKLQGYGAGVLYLHPDRHSMMLYVVDERMDSGRAQKLRIGGESARGDGGAGWKPSVQLAHEFSLLPRLERPGVDGMLGQPPCMAGRRGYTLHRTTALHPAGEGESDDADGGEGADGSISDDPDNPMWGGVTTGCTSVQDMQNRIFKLGFGPSPLYRRAGVVIHVSPLQDDDDDADARRIGCIVPHRRGRHRCCTPGVMGTCGSDARVLGGRERGQGNARSETEACDDEGEDDDEDDDDEGDTENVVPVKCYFCHNNPFFEVLFNNPNPSPYTRFLGTDDGEQGASYEATSTAGWATVPVTPSRAVSRVLPVGTRLLISVRALCKLSSAFNVSYQTHIRKEVRAAMVSEALAAVSQGFIAPSADDVEGRRNPSAKRNRRIRIKRDHLAERVDDSLVRCFLNVTSVLHCMDGFACVAISCERRGHKHAGHEVKNLYIAPQDLQIPSGDAQWERAARYIVL